MNIDILEIRMMINTKDIANEQNHFIRNILCTITYSNMSRVDDKKNPLVISYTDSLIRL